MGSSITYLETLPNFLAWFATSVALFAGFVGLYVLVTPWREFRLIRAGNAAAALSFSGMLVGYALVLSGVVRNAVSRGDLVTWALVGFAVQILALGVARLVLGPEMRARMERGDLGAAVVLAGTSLAFGLLNAATMTPDGTGG